MTRRAPLGPGLALAAALALAGCAEDPRINTATGAVVGGLLGGAVGGGPGLTLGGAAIGAVLGSQNRLQF